MSAVFSLDKAICQVQIIMSDVFSLAKAIPVQIVSTAITKAIQRITVKSFNNIGTKFLGLMTLDSRSWTLEFRDLKLYAK